MRPSKKEYAFALKYYNEVHHTTLDPEKAGVVRIHLIPPKYSRDNIEASVAIINGQDIVPVNISWSILLTAFIEEVNKYSGRQVTDEDVDTIMDNTCNIVRKIYPFVGKKRFRKDIIRMMNTFKQIAYGEETEEAIAYMNIGDYADQMTAPHRMDLMISAMTKDGKWHCNQKCVHCYAAGQECSSEEELDTDSWKKIIDKCREAKIPQITFTGGEPTMRDDLVELVDHAQWFVTRLNTNGIKLSEELCQKLKEASLDSMQITFYSYNEDIHNKLVGAAHYKDTVAGIENAVKTGLNLSINTPLCTLNRDYVSTLKFLKEKGVRYVTCSGLITTGNAAKEESENLQLTNAEVRDIVKEAVEYCYANDMDINFTSPGWMDDIFCRELGISTPNCGACLSNMAITPSGNVVPCQSWLSDKPLGNILNDKWEDIWNNETCKERRDFSSKMRGECPLRILKGGKSC
ncbi:MAG: radical SAM protein [Lachnospiraceae bacterium]|nr:radical SAM protein [Lachnospiraceae bacterium]